ncbi:unnamed protein product [Gongylonema pulchrum]|uniref:Uncharacterized protein n=1 Tax=Gongylonema pulchrum TaxID=637853 RepID=A0A183F1G6_9BILA|nr:unnamed protein product [Gongylonema pulchrum]
MNSCVIHILEQPRSPLSGTIVGFQRRFRSYSGVDTCWRIRSEGGEGSFALMGSDSSCFTIENWFYRF